MSNKSSKTKEFTNLLTAHYPRIYNFIFTLVPNKADADDIMQDTSVIMLQKFDSFRPDSDFVSWAAQIAKYECLKYYRKKRRKSVFTTEVFELLAEEAQEQQNELDKKIEALKSCVSKQNAKDCRLIDMRYFEGMKLREIAEKTGRSIQSIFRSFSRIHFNLIKCVRNTLEREGY
ncbi:RNA polymerase sigma factor SigV [Sedimentisphaera cyanobacteriorum]|uniref:RNA polymerase sigma factor SigV n=1 Tax=Sedimentisphaera cyanobacteriorum TaxID=1940790 RepID=A0A1Q2HNZ9_9BACT|nr:sigma-70 family RNA polymerase sigma factor [Sedimentisphaera cyanobacteriorum]AQQ08976.1 RNA polymerase sigma factor SigV [Sedimentisphaera cyanobacteriorum]